MTETAEQNIFRVRPHTCILHPDRLATGRESYQDLDSLDGRDLYEFGLCEQCQALWPEAALGFFVAAKVEVTSTPTTGANAPPPPIEGPSIEPAVQAAADAINALPGARVIGGCIPAGRYLLQFHTHRTKAGWRALEIIAWVVDRIGDTIMPEFVCGLPPAMFWMIGGKDPDVLAKVLREAADQWGLASAGNATGEGGAQG